MEFDPFMLSRIQFAANITFHIMFPSITIALGWVLLFFKWRYNTTQDEAWMQAYCNRLRSPVLRLFVIQLNIPRQEFVYLLGVMVGQLFEHGGDVVEGIDIVCLTGFCDAVDVGGGMAAFIPSWS